MVASPHADARHFAALERRLFEVLGGWAPVVAEPDVKVGLRVASFRHAWHGELWEGLASSTEPAPPLVLVEALAAATSTAQRLSGLYGVVLPALVAAYERRLAAASADTAAGGPLARVLTLALADDRAELAWGRRQVEQFGAHPDFERHLGATGGVEPQKATEHHEIDRVDRGS